MVPLGIGFHILSCGMRRCLASRPYLLSSSLRARAVPRRHSKPLRMVLRRRHELDRCDFKSWGFRSLRLAQKQGCDCGKSDRDSSRKHGQLQPVARGCCSWFFHSNDSTSVGNFYRLVELSSLIHEEPGNLRFLLSLSRLVDHYEQKVTFPSIIGIYSGTERH